MSMNDIYTKKIEKHGKVLQLLALDNEGGKHDFEGLSKIVEEEFELLSPYIKRPAQIIFVRDNRDFSINDLTPGGSTFVPTETMISLPNWKNLDMQQLRSVVAHELHHMARWQNPGYGATLGEAITSEGIATYYEEMRSGWKPVFAQIDIPENVWQRARTEWDKGHYNHMQWFHDDKQYGYAIGYKLAGERFKDFDLGATVMITGKELFNYLP